MPTIITHAVAGAAIAQAFAPCSRRSEVTWIAAGCAMLPDADVLGFSVGIAYGDMFGHRGITHSLLFAGLAALLVTAVFRNKVPGRDLAQILVCIFAATASHGMLDACTDGGLGVAFFAPFERTRYFFPFRPILVSPIGLSAFLSERGADVLLSEMQWVWPPSLGVVAAARWARCRK